MKFKVTFKTPDAVDEGIEEGIQNHQEEYPNLSDAAITFLYEKCETVANKYTEFGEYITVEFDTGKGTCTVLPIRR